MSTENISFEDLVIDSVFDAFLDGHTKKKKKKKKKDKANKKSKSEPSDKKKKQKDEKEDLGLFKAADIFERFPLDENPEDMPQKDDPKNALTKKEYIYEIVV
ncbi:MAG: hypothetical protein PHF63_00860 [Herbinix sp.]|nr:hypothetical protein [Herbinix sp.]